MLYLTTGFIVLYGDDIPKYEKLFVLFQTYLISCAKVRDPHGYSIQAGTYELVVDRYTIVEAITNDDGLEAPLPAPRKLKALPFSAIGHQHPGVEFDVLTVIANCSAIQYTADQSKHFREAIVMDQSKKPFLFTIWDDLADNEGTTLLHHLHEYPVILAKRIGVTEFRGGTKFPCGGQNIASRPSSVILFARLLKLQSLCAPQNKKIGAVLQLQATPAINPKVHRHSLMMSTYR
ncbi:hypothetical protein P3S67_026307 [Capsicum chacoense]